MDVFLYKKKFLPFFPVSIEMQLTVLLFWTGVLWGHVKDQIYADNPQSIETLKTNIRLVIGNIEPQ